MSEINKFNEKLTEAYKKQFPGDYEHITFKLSDMNQKVIEIHLADDATPEFINKFKSIWPDAKITYLKFTQQDYFHLITEENNLQTQGLEDEKEIK